MTQPQLPFRPFQQSPERAFAASAAKPDAKTALVFIDTNVLLAPYKASTEALSAIEQTFGQLRDQKRLVVPAQVAREFAFNRPNLVAQLHKVVSDSRSISLNGRLEGVPILVGTPEYVEAHKRLSEMQASLKEFRGAIEKLVDRIESWERSDPVLDVYSRLLTSDVVKDLQMDAAQLEAHRKSRFDAKVPPGFRDKAKEDGGVGDLAIWFTILAVCESENRDAIFITEDSKDDWFHRSGDRRLFPRYELVEEFGERTGGKCFGTDSLSSLLKQYGASESVVREVRERESAPWDSEMDAIDRFRHARELVVKRLGQLTSNIPIALEDSRRFPDILLHIGVERLGMEIFLTSQPDFAKRAKELILRAIQVRQQQGLDEVVIIFASEPGRGTSIENWVGEGSYFGVGVSTVVAEVTQSALVIRSNSSSHPFVRSAFPEGRV